MGDSSQTKTDSSSMTRDPWKAAVPGLTNVLGQTSSLYDQTNNGNLPGALKSGQNGIIANATGGATTAAANSGLSQVGHLIGGGGQTPTGTAAVGNINGALGSFGAGNANLTSMLTPMADGSQVGASNTEFQRELQSNLDSAADTIGSRFAGAGRYGSGAMAKVQAKTLGDVAAGATQNQYNQDQQNRLAAIGQLTGINAGALSGAISGNTATAGIGQNNVSNLLAGVGALPSLNTSQNLDANNLATVGGQSWANLDNAASIFSNLGQLGGSGSSNGTSTTTNENSVLGNILAGVGGVGNLFSAPAGGTSAIAGLGKAFSLFSDRRLKQDVERIGELFDGQPVYRFRYKGDPTWQIGLMAQEVAEAAPEAVHLHDTGFLMVDYGAATRAAAAQGGA